MFKILMDSCKNCRKHLTSECPIRAWSREQHYLDRRGKVVTKEPVDSKKDYCSRFASNGL